MMTTAEREKLDLSLEEQCAVSEAAIVLAGFGIDVALPWNCSLDDLEQERYEALVKSCRAYRDALVADASPASGVTDDWKLRVIVADAVTCMEHGSLATPVAEMLKAALNLPAPASGWQPIETAPKDGTRFLAFTSDFEYGVSFNQCVQEARWSGKTPDDHVGHFQSRNGQMVLYWMPMPAPPPLIRGERSGS